MSHLPDKSRRAIEKQLKLIRARYKSGQLTESQIHDTYLITETLRWVMWRDGTDPIRLLLPK